MELIKKYLEKIIKETLTHSEIIVIAHSIESAIEIHWQYKNISFFLPTLKKYGLTINQRQATARLILKEIEEIELSQSPLPFDMSNEVNQPEF